MSQLEIEALAGFDEAARRHETRRLEREYAQPWPHPGGPYSWQCEFHEKGATNAERAILANNQGGKSRTCAAESSIHLTGLYPKWWKGRVFKGAIEALACGVTNEETRNICQKQLLGEIVEDRAPDGTGWIPGSCIGKTTFRQCGVANVVDEVRVRHVSGKWSVLRFKSYEQGSVKFQGVQYDVCWMDEEPDKDDGIFSEIQTRLFVRKGSLMLSRTPLFGRTPLVEHFMRGGPQVYCKNVTYLDSPHKTKEEWLEQADRWPDHERNTRLMGLPMMGQGAVFPVDDAQVTCEPFPIPPHYRCIVGIDFGIDHPAAAVWLAHDADADTVYLYDCYKAAGQTPVYHREAIERRGDWIPVAWPHDGLNREKSSGRNLIEQYKLRNAIGCSARYTDDKGGGQDTEPVVMEVLERMRTGRFKVFTNCGPWLEEKRMYHRKDGKIVKVNDDLLAASFYGLMMLRYGLSKSQANVSTRQTTARGSYDPLAQYLTR